MSITFVFATNIKYCSVSITVPNTLQNILFEYLTNLILYLLLPVSKQTYLCIKLSSQLEKFLTATFSFNENRLALKTHQQIHLNTWPNCFFFKLISKFWLLTDDKTKLLDLFETGLLTTDLTINNMHCLGKVKNTSFREE